MIDQAGESILGAASADEVGPNAWYRRSGRHAVTLLAHARCSRLPDHRLVARALLIIGEGRTDQAGPGEHEHQRSGAGYASHGEWKLCYGTPV